MMGLIEIVSAKYFKDVISGETVSINVVTKELDKNGNTFDLTRSVPINEYNRFYNEVKRQVDAGTLTIAEAD
jgi:hypothetical protein